MNRKAQLEEQRVQIRQLKEQAALVAKKNDQSKLSLQKGLYVRKQSQETIGNQSTTNTILNTQGNHQFSIGSISQTNLSNLPQNNTPTSSKQKIVLKKEQILQSFCNANNGSKKVYIKPEKKGTSSGIFCTLETLSQTPS